MASLFDGSAEQFRKFVPVNRNFSLKNVLPSLDALADDLLPRFLGQATADLIVSKVGETLDPDDDRAFIRALALSRSAIAKLGFAAYLPFAEVQIDDDGVTVTAVADRKAAFEYQTNKLVKALLETGWQDLDKLIQLVDAQRVAFPQWEDAPYFREHQEALFTSPVDFSKAYPINDQWLTFWALRPFIRAVEDDRGRESNARIDALPDTVTDDQKKVIMRWLLRAVAYQSVIDALPNLSVEINGTSVQVNYASQYGNATYYTPPTRDMLDWVLAKLQKQADLAWNAFETTLAATLPPVDAADDVLGLLDTEGPFIML